MQSSDVLLRQSRPPDLTLSYGSGIDRVADVRIPAKRSEGQDAAAEPLPLVLFLHGGFWRAAYDRTHTGPLAESLAASGFVVCAPEYRKVGQSGGGWPGTFEDVIAAVQALPALVAEAVGGMTDGARAIIAGHSAGGHLALWATAQRRSWHEVRAPRIEVVSLAGVCDLSGCYRQGLGNGAAAELMGGGPEQFPDRYGAADPMNLIPIGVAASLVHGTADDRVPYQQSQEFAAKAQAVGDEVSCTLIDGCGHFDVIDPLSAAWPTVLATFQSAAARLDRT